MVIKIQTENCKQPQRLIMLKEVKLTNVVFFK